MPPPDNPRPDAALTLDSPVRTAAETRPERGALGDQEVAGAPNAKGEKLEQTKAQRSCGEQTEEVDVWWGSYASRTMLPSFVLCVAATVGIAWLTWALLPARLVKFSFFGLSGGVWLLQLVRWGYRFFGFNYRLTTRRLFCHLGKLYQGNRELELAAVAQVVVRSRWDERLVGVGQIVVKAQSPATPPLILEGILQPARLAEEIRTRVQRAREQGVLQTRAGV
jgi:hypothetical protein